MMKAKKIVSIILPVILAFSYTCKPALAAGGKKLTLFYAANLTTVMNELTEEFKKTNPDTEIISESSGSVLAVKKVTELNRQADLIFVADYTLIQNTLIPKYADWAIELFKDPVVIAFTDKSRYTNEITAQNWYKILLKPEITYGYANPALAPIGYHTLIVWQLADAYYNEKIKDKKISELLEAKCPQDYIRPDVPELIPLIESMSLDYLFIYRSTAQQHNLKFIELPDEINLGNDKFSENYKKASVTITDAKGKSETRYGKPVIFAFTILKDAPNKETALKFAGLLLSKTGRQIFKQNFQPLMEPVAAINGENLPAELKQ